MSIRRILALSFFVLRLARHERVVIAFFILSLLFMSVMNAVFLESYQDILREKIELFYSWEVVAFNMAYLVAAIFLVLIITICFLPVLRQLFCREYLITFLSKPVKIGEYLAGIFLGMFFSLISVIFLWWVIVILTLYFHTHEFFFSSGLHFLSVGAVALIVLGCFFFFYSFWRGPLGAIFCLFMVGAGFFYFEISAFQEGLSFPFDKLVFFSKFLIPPLNYWVYLGFLDSEINFSLTAVILHSVLILLFYLSTAYFRFKKRLTSIE